MSIFNKIKLMRPKRTMHNLSYPMSVSLDFGGLVPIMCEKVVPGDKFFHSHEFLLRMSPFVSQVYQSYAVKFEYFYVPSRLLWHNFSKFLVEDDNTVYPHPQISLSELFDGEHTMENTLVDYIEGVAGKPAYVDNVFQLQPLDGSAIGKSVDALAYAALLKIYLDYYIDENLFSVLYGSSTFDYNALCEEFDSLIHLNGSDYGDYMKGLFMLVNNCVGSDNPRELFQFFRRSYPKDYFTSALPWAQRGPIVQIPLNGEGDVIVRGLDHSAGRYDSYGGVFARYKENGISSEPTEVTLFSAPSMSMLSTTTPITDVASGSTLSTRTALSSWDAANITAEQIRQIPDQRPITFKAVNVNGTATITDLRTAMTVQAWLEKNARCGVREKEQLAAHFGVRSRDYRLDRAELLQSTNNVVHIGEIFTTAQNEDNTFLPGLGVSTGTGTGASPQFKRFFEEHGYVIGFMSIFPRAKYSQGIRRQRFELDKFDYYWPEFQHIGEQDIYNAELFLDDENPSRNFGTFGYAPRYAHYKFRNGEVHGDFTNTLNFMTASRQFTNPPTLNTDFINIDPDRNHLYRTFNAVATPYSNALPVQVDLFHNFKALRPMDYFGSPRVI